MLTGNNGILAQASEAKKRSEIAEAKERAQLDIIDWQTNQIRDGKVANLNDRIVESILTGKDYVQSTGDISFIAKSGGYEILYSDLYSGGNLEEGTEQESEVNVPKPDGATIIVSDPEQGIVMRDKNNNEWVWIEVPKSVTASSTTDTEIETALQAYATDYRKSGYWDIWNDRCGLTETQYYMNKSKMLQSIKTNGGFWIGRYEVGTDTIRASSETMLTTPLIQQDKYVYNFVTCSQAQSLASQLNPDNNYTSSLMNGIQWDLICKYIETRGAKTQAEIKTNSTTWGNYKNATFDVTRGKYSTDNGQNYTDVAGTYIKPESAVLLTTGASERNKVLNIYDLAGNESEWLLGKGSANLASVYLLDAYYADGGIFPVVFRDVYSGDSGNSYIGFRPTLY